MHHITTTIEGLVSGVELLVVGLPLLLYGALAGLLAGVRDRLVVVAASVPMAVGLLVITTQVLGSLGVHLQLWVVAVLALVPAAAVGSVPWLVRQRSGQPAHDDTASTKPWYVWAAAAAGAALAVAAWLPGIPDPALPPQNIDDVWHGFLTRRIADLEVITAASMSPVRADATMPTTFYPYGLHLASATLWEVTGASIPVVLNAMWATGVGVMLPFGVAALLHVLQPHRPSSAALAAVVASGLQFFPYALTGIQPYAFAVSMTPAVLALVAHHSGRGTPATGFALVVCGVGALVAHPAATTAIAVIAVFVAAEVAVRGGLPGVRQAALRLLPVAVLAWLIARPFLRSAAGTSGQLAVSKDIPYADPLVAVGDFLLLKTPWTPAGQPVLAVFALVGLAACVFGSRHGWSIVAGYLVLLAILVGASSGAAWARPYIGTWYGEWHRLAGPVVLLASVLAGVGADAVLRLLTKLGGARRDVRAPRFAMVAVAGLVLALVFARGVAHGVLSGRSTVQAAWQPRIVTTADLALYAEAAKRVGPDDLVLNNWDDGSGWMYAIGGVRPAVPYVFSGDPNWSRVVGRVAALEPADCRFLLRHDVTHVLATRHTANPNPLLLAAEANPAALQPVYRGATGSIFRFDQSHLMSCAQESS